MMLWGLPQDDPKPASSGILTGRSITMTTETPDPVNPDGPYRERLSAERFEKSLRVVINSVVFRSSGQDLTTTGTYTEMATRLTRTAGPGRPGHPRPRQTLTAAAPTTTADDHGVGRRFLGVHRAPPSGGGCAVCRFVSGGSYGEQSSAFKGEGGALWRISFGTPSSASIST